MININKKRLYLIPLIIIVISLDQITKYIIFIDNINLVNKDFILFTIDYVKNYGAAFNIFNGNRIFLSLVSIILSILLIYLIIKKINTKSIEPFGYSFILAGSIGNGIDRILKGYVIDFINLNYINFPVFNIADLSINIGLIIFLYTLVKSK
tara:strand:+ start:21 stop:476 length:456 start_codon:yes stop_codon:yes gene_type:complete